ncbi:MAG: 23S rRNA (pseudouridine(1915)-N(3))-methyltransferase RlmH [Gammaproteobacteria bacterium]
MRLSLLAVGTVSRWVSDGFESYRSRLPPALRPTVCEVAQASARERGNGRSRQAETQRLLNQVPGDTAIILLDPEGELVTTEEWAHRLASFQASSCDCAFLIGGADGLDREARRKADWVWSLSPLTFPHAFVRLIWIEQLYRAWTLLSHHPYHRA